MAPHTRSESAPVQPAAWPVVVNPFGAYALTVEVDGERYPFRGSEVSGLDRRALRLGLGVTASEMVSTLAAGRWGEPDILAALVFLARRQNGERDTLVDPTPLVAWIESAEQVSIIPDGGGDDPESLAAN